MDFTSRERVDKANARFLFNIVSLGWMIKVIAHPLLS